MGYEIPVAIRSPKLKKKQVQLVANGDLRQSANEKCWPEQEKMEASLKALWVRWATNWSACTPTNRSSGTGSSARRRKGWRSFANVDRNAPLIVAESVWQYSHHLLHGLISHRGPILTVANWSGTWPGLVGMLNLNGSMTKAGVEYSTIWSEDFTDQFFRDTLHKWLKAGHVKHKTPHVQKFKNIKVGGKEKRLADSLAQQLLREKAIMGIFDEGCMGMYNAVIPDELLHPTGVYKERLSQSALYYETTQVSDDEARDVRRWMEEHGMTFNTGANDESDLTDDQIQQQCKMYIAALRIADDFGCRHDRHSIPAGLKDLLPASDLVEGTLNNAERPPVRSRDGSACCTTASRCRISMRWMSARARWVADVPRSQSDGPAGGEHAARPALGRYRSQRDGG
jgi:hypothetical protein